MNQNHYYDFMRENGWILVYTDGACSNNGRANARAGYGTYWGENHPLNRAEPVVGSRVTNNIAEIQAAIRAVLDAKIAEIDEVRIKTDSKYLIKAWYHWIPHIWIPNNWLRKTGEPVINKKEFLALKYAVRNSGMRVQFKYVPSHSENKGNEMADRLARQGAQLYRKFIVN